MENSDHFFTELSMKEYQNITGGSSGDLMYKIGYGLGYLFTTISDGIQSAYEGIVNGMGSDPSLMEAAKNNPVAIWN